ncbi:hypothetical protein ACS2Q5_34415, partial [Bacillus cereus group sp. Bce022]
IYNKKNEKVYLHDWKNTYIRKPLRISLAIHSLLELVLMFTCAYILTFIMFGNQIGFQDKESEKSFKHEMVTEVKSEQNITKVYIEKESSCKKRKPYRVGCKDYATCDYGVSILFI